MAVLVVCCGFPNRCQLRSKIKQTFALHAHHTTDSTQMQITGLVFIILASVGIADAQTTIDFKVVDATKNITISGATCSVYNIKDNELVISTTSSKSGRCFVTSTYNFFTSFHKLRLSHPSYFVYETQLNKAPPMQIGLVPRYSNKIPAPVFVQCFCLYNHNTQPKNLWQANQRRYGLQRRISASRADVG